MLTLSDIDLAEIAAALEDQSYDHRWLIDPSSGEIAYWTEDSGLDGDPVDLDDVDLTAIDPLPSWVWYRDMADFAEAVTDERAGRRLARALGGRGAFRRFRDELYEEFPALLPVWHTFRDTRGRRHAVEWLRDSGLVSDEEAQADLAVHPDPAVP